MYITRNAKKRKDEKHTEIGIDKFQNTCTRTNENTKKAHKLRKKKRKSKHRRFSPIETPEVFQMRSSFCLFLLISFLKNGIKMAAS